jgi:hypothetical protein
LSDGLLARRVPGRQFEDLFRIDLPADWEFEPTGECSFRIRPAAGGGRQLEVWYSPLPGTLGQDEMDEWVQREASRCRDELGLTAYLGGLWSAVGPSAVLQGLSHESGRARWRVVMLLALPRVLLTGEYAHPIGGPSAAAANIGAIKGEVDHVLAMFFSSAPAEARGPAEASH